MKKIIKFLLPFGSLIGSAVLAGLHHEIQLYNYVHRPRIESNGALFDDNNEAQKRTGLAERKKIAEYLHAIYHVEKTPFQCPYLYNSTAINELLRERQPRDPLYEAIKNNAPFSLDKLVRPGSEVHYILTNKFVFETIFADNISDLCDLLGEGAEGLNAHDQHGESLLHMASSYGGEKVVRYLIVKKVGVNSANKRGWTALDNAIVHNLQRPVIAEILRANGAVRGQPQNEEIHSSSSWAPQEIEELRQGLLAQLRNH